MSHSSALNALYRLAETHYVGPKISRPRFDRLLDPNAALDPRGVIKVAGTNGKGSVAAMLEAVALADGLRVGVFTSPHLVRIEERIRIDGQDVSPSLLDAASQAFLPKMEACIETQDPEWVPTFFEVLMHLAIRLFAEASVDVAIFEAGIGGRSDVTHLLPAELSIVTTVGLDHQDELGNTEVEIGMNKAGIASPDSTLIIGPMVKGPVLEAIRTQGKKNRVRTRVASKDQVSVARHELSRIEAVLPGDLQVELPFGGLHQRDNLAVCVSVVDEWVERGVLRDRSALRGVRHTRWAGRMERLNTNPPWILDGAHNPEAMTSLHTTLDGLLPYEQRVLVYGASGDHGTSEIFRMVQNMAPTIYLVEGFYKSVSLERLRLYFGPNVEGFSDVKRCFETLQARYRNSDRHIIATGSLFLVGQLRELGR